MPYIITTRKPGPVKRDGSPLCVTSGRPVVVATLDEARKAAWGRPFDWRGTCEHITQDGGTVTSPDGTIIEVRPS